MILYEYLHMSIIDSIITISTVSLYYVVIIVFIIAIIVILIHIITSVFDWLGMHAVGEIQ